MYFFLHLVLVGQIEIGKVLATV